MVVALKNMCTRKDYLIFLVLQINNQLKALVFPPFHINTFHPLLVTNILLQRRKSLYVLMFDLMSFATHTN
jgi:hypothetical protein